MRKILLAALCLATLGCDKSNDFFLSVNQDPVISIFYKGNEIDSFVDSIKIGTPLYFEYNIQDEENLSLLPSDTTVGVNFQFGRNSFHIHGDTEGFFNVQLFTFDSFNVRSAVPFSLRVFRNLKPICVLNSSSLGEKTVEVDLSSSYDKDKRFGGSIVMYEFDFNGYIFESTSSKVRHVFATNGQKRIRARVKDNNNEWSNWEEKYVQVN
jgi:hypothetical protein